MVYIVLKSLLIKCTGGIQRERENSSRDTKPCLYVTNLSHVAACVFVWDYIV